MLRTFLYISDSKLDEYSQQIDTNPGVGRSSEFALNAGVVSVKVSEQRAAAAPNRFQRLQRLEDNIRKHEKVGSVESPAKWIEGRGLALATLINEGDKAVFYFIRSGGAYLGLGGSAHHIVGAQPEKSTRFGYSYAPSLIQNLCNMDASPKLLSQTEERLSQWVSVGVCDGENSWCGMVYDMCHRRQSRSFTVPIAFLAKKLIVGSYQGKQVTLATPLYVEQVD